MYLNNTNAKFVDNWNKSLESYGVDERQIFSFLSVFSNMNGDVEFTSSLLPVEIAKSEPPSGQGEQLGCHFLASL